MVQQDAMIRGWHVHGGGLFIASDIERFASQLHAIDAFSHRGEVKDKGLLQDEERRDKENHPGFAF